VSEYRPYPMSIRTIEVYEKSINSYPFLI